MKRLALLLSTLLLAASAHADWAGLWQTPDQRGDRLLHDGNASAAAKAYHDPRRKAFAEQKAGDYKAAAKDLEPLSDAEAQYNRGNALAHAGDLDGALKAYDAALAKDPASRDARHNRELVQQALKQQEQQQKSGKDGQKGEGKDKPQDGKDKSGQDQDGKGGQQGKDQTGKDSQSKGQQGQQPKPAAGSGQQSAAEARAEAARDVKAGQDKAHPGAAGNKDSAATLSLPEREQAQAREQWLRAIPDDPGGLLRRKLQLEYQRRHPQNEQTAP